MVRAVERVRERLTRTVAALEAAAIPYAVAGDQAVAAWVARVDEAAVRNAPDVDILLRRDDLERAKQAMAAAGFVYRHVKGIDLFLDGPDADPRDAVKIVFAAEKVRPEYSLAAPDVSDSVPDPAFRLLALEALVRMKLTSFRLKDQVHIQDMIGVGLLDETWPARLPPPLGERLQKLLENPNA